MLGMFRRYAIGAAGPIGAAAAQFALSLILLRRLEPGAFGSFAFLLVVAQLSLGVWGALFSAPLPALTAATATAGKRERVRRGLFAACLAGSFVAAVVFLLMALALEVGLGASVLFAGFSAVSLLRWFARALGYVAGEPLRTLMSDLVYSAVLLIGVAAMLMHWDAGIGGSFLLLLVAATLGLVPFGRRYFVEQFADFSLADLRSYQGVWNDHARWSLLGVVTTELTANAHVYLVTLIYGPASFAAIAASALLIRPVTVVQNALGEFERTRIARDLADGGLTAADRSVRLFRFALIAAWGATATASTALFLVAPRLIFPETYALTTLVTGTALWLAVALVRLARTPESILLQAAGEFRNLAWASVVSCGWSVVAVLIMTAATGPLWSIAGVFLGEAIFAIWIWRQTRLWRAAHHALTG